MVEGASAHAEVQEARGYCTVAMAITGSALDLDGSVAVYLRRVPDKVSSGKKREMAEIEARCRVSTPTSLGFG